MIPNISVKSLVKSLKNSVVLPVHEPISFDFEEQVRAKAEASEEQRRFTEMPLDIAKEYKTPSYRDSGGSSNGALPNTVRSEYIYDYNVVAELSAICRRKKRR
ncbi:MAG: hypothetical protein K2J80_04630 [Oscillospiraceae bacterium]|nr:hypothetical protein [Oscillospiraceae bacterium]